MIRGYHVIFGSYGFWLPNDPRGSWSEFVAAWELRRFGEATKTLERKSFQELTVRERNWLAAARNSLKYPQVHFEAPHIEAIANGFAKRVTSSGYEIWECSILSEHVHLVIGRHGYRVELMAGLLKGEATKEFRRRGVHPLAEYANEPGEPPSPWADGMWKVYFYNELSIESAINYVRHNPEKEGKPRRSWQFVRPFTGIDSGVVSLNP